MAHKLLEISLNTCSRTLGQFIDFFIHVYNVRGNQNKVNTNIRF